LAKHQRHQMVPGRETLDVFIPAMSCDDRGKAPSWNRFQQTAEHRIFVAHAKHSFLSLFNQKDTTKPRWRLACSHNSLTRSPDSPAVRREKPGNVQAAQRVVACSFPTT